MCRNGADKMENKEMKVIPQFTAIQFLESSDPYEWLYQFKDDKFLLRQLLQKMKQQAGALGIRCFISLWDSYCEMQARKNGVSFENSTCFDGQEIERFSGQYICDDFGIAVTDKYGFQQVICRHPIMPVQRLINIDSGEERLKIAYKKGRVWRSIIAEKSMIASSNSILQLAANGVLVNSENAKPLSTYLLEIENLNYRLINLENNLDVVMEVIEYIYNNIMYAELNTKSDYCQVCGYTGEILIDDNLEWYCPNCGNRDHDKLNVARRTCGYIGTNFWNKGRTQEIKERVVHIDNKDDE